MTNDIKTSLRFECAVCLQSCVHPVKLPCSHVFCFLCVKGVASRSKRCALCRQEIPIDYFNQPHLIESINLDETVSFDDGYQWFYEGRNGWWQYDERSSLDIEQNYKAGTKFVELLVAGFLYTLDFDNMVQYRRSDPSRRRRIKRDLITSTVRKGVAGLKVVRPSDVAAGQELPACDKHDSTTDSPGVAKTNVSNSLVTDLSTQALDNTDVETGIENSGPLSPLLGDTLINTSSVISQSSNIAELTLELSNINITDGSTQSRNSNS